MINRLIEILRISLHLIMRCKLWGISEMSYFPPSSQMGWSLMGMFLHSLLSQS